MIKIYAKADNRPKGYIVSNLKPKNKSRENFKPIAFHQTQHGFPSISITFLQRIPF